MKRIWFGVFRILLFCAGIIIAAAFTMNGSAERESFNYFSAICCIIALLLLFLIVVIEIVSALKIYDSTKHTVFLSLALFTFAATAENVEAILSSYGLKLHSSVFESFNFLFFICCVLCILYFINYVWKLKTSKREAVCVITFSAVIYASYVPLTFINLQYIPYVIYTLAMIVYYAYRIIPPVYKANADDETFHLSYCILYALFGAETCNVFSGAEILYSGAKDYLPLYSMVIVSLFVSVYIAFIIRSSRAAQKASEYKLQAETLKSEVLKEQIKPHFIFNTLAVIKSMYHNDIADGDMAINLFSRHLRSNIDADGAALVPFEDELNNVQNYVDLVNLRHDEKFEVIFNIDCTDFNVPVLSLQPFVENAMKYSKVNYKEDGFIEISSEETDNEIILGIYDNGAGFNVGKISENSHGIKNACERFRILLNAKVKIVSNIGKGTRVIIRIPKEKEENIR